MARELLFGHTKLLVRAHPCVSMDRYNYIRMCVRERRREGEAERERICVHMKDQICFYSFYVEARQSQTSTEGEKPSWEKGMHLK